MTQEQLNELVTGLLVDNSTGQINPYKVRQVFYAVIESMNTGTSGVTATAPLNFDAFTSTFSMLQASASTNGWLSSADWTAFNSAVSGLSEKEDSANKAITMTGNTASNTVFLTAKAIYDWAVGLFQVILVSGTNIKTLNGQSILGSGNLIVSGSDYKKTQKWFSQGGTAVLQKIGVRLAYPEVYVGTAINNDNAVYASKIRTTRESATTAGSSAEIRTGNDSVAFFCVAYGFKIVIKANHSGASGMAHYTGIISNVATTGNVEPSTLLNCIGYGFDSTDTNIQIFHNDNSGTCTKIDLGTDFPVTFSDDYLYELTVECVAPAINSFGYTFKKFKKSTGALLPNAVLDKTTTGTIITNHPVDVGSGGFSWRCWSGNRALTSAVRCSISEVIVETNW